MLHTLRRWLSPSPGRTRPAGRSFRPSVESLEDRATPADVAVLGATLQTPTSIQLTYQAADVPAFQVAVYRSADETLDTADVPVTDPTRVTPRRGTGPQVAAVRLAAELPIDPTRPYVLVAADPLHAIAESAEANNVASFRKLALAAVVHGLQPNGQMPAWVETAAAGLTRQGFAAVIPFDWAAVSRQSNRGAVAWAGATLATQVRATADALGTLPTDVVDLQIISHSRGAPVASQALQLLAKSAPRELALGYVQATFLDPHPVANRGRARLERSGGTGVSTGGGFSYDPTNASAAALAASTIAFQAAAADPPVVIPANVDRAESIYQRLAWSQTTTEERGMGFNLWGLRPGDFVNRSGRPIGGGDIGFTGVGHSSVQHWYIAAVLGG